MQRDMNDEFEKYVKQQRNALDTEEPKSEYLWEGVQAALLKKKYKRRVQLWRGAAVLFALITIGQLTYRFLQPRVASNHHGPIETDETVSMQKGAFHSLEANYQKEVEALENQVQSKKINPAEYAVLLGELNYIEEVEDEFKSDIPLVNDKERLAEILVDTYEKKIKLLERLLEQIERDERREQQFKEL
jgi:hypothetical protein